ncbi:hypothetical protein GQR58_019109 [Nymphon striatum]|nr:hypothetical protein GQR58_019109 [Nymphon striatum]
MTTTTIPVILTGDQPDNGCRYASPSLFLGQIVFQEHLRHKKNSSTFKILLEEEPTLGLFLRGKSKSGLHWNVFINNSLGRCQESSQTGATNPTRVITNLTREKFCCPAVRQLNLGSKNLRDFSTTSAVLIILLNTLLKLGSNTNGNVKWDLSSESDHVFHLYLNLWMSYYASDIPPERGDHITVGPVLDLPSESDHVSRDDHSNCKSFHQESNSKKNYAVPVAKTLKLAWADIFFLLKISRLN